MSAPAGEPPVPPNQPSSNDRKDESPSSGQTSEQTGAAAGEDVKMKEAKPEKPEETWDDIPEHVLKVSAYSCDLSKLCLAD